MPKNIIVNRIKKAEIITNSQNLKINIDDIVINRTLFDQWLAEKAQNNGCEIIKGKKIAKPEKADYIIGADGPLSTVAKHYGMYGKREFYTARQILVKGNFDKTLYKIYLDIAPDFFAWIVPEDNAFARIGIASKKNTASYFKIFLEKLKIKNTDILENQGGLIPIFDKNHVIQKNNVFLVGDAALQVKATTGGGIISGLKAADILADCIINKKDYQKELKPLRKELTLHLKIRKTLNKFSEKDYDRLLKMIDNRKSKEILENINRDNAKKMLVELMMKNPKLLLFLSKLI